MQFFIHSKFKWVESTLMGNYASIQHQVKQQTNGFITRVGRNHWLSFNNPVQLNKPLKSSVKLTSLGYFNNHWIKITLLWSIRQVLVILTNEWIYMQLQCIL